MKELLLNADRSEKFWMQVSSIGAGCWDWQGTKDPSSYGHFSVRFGNKWRPIGAHRITFALAFGDIVPAGMQLDHLCRNTSCVNPYHLDIVTPAVNSHRRALAQTHCKRGHEFTPENTRISPSNRRICRACYRKYKKKRYKDGLTYIRQTPGRPYRFAGRTRNALQTWAQIYSRKYQMARKTKR